MTDRMLFAGRRCSKLSYLKKRKGRHLVQENELSGSCPVKCELEIINRIAVLDKRTPERGRRSVITKL